CALRASPPAVTSLSSERNQRIRPTRTARREEGRRRGGKAKDEHGSADGRGIRRIETKKEARQQARHRERGGDAGGGAERHGRGEFDHQTANDSRPAGAERQARP